jgi:SAM-dependent methyltransferase
LRWCVVRPIVANLRPGTILELGCGLGAVGVRLARMGTYTAVEPDVRSWAVANDRIAPLGATVIHGDHTKADHTKADHTKADHTKAPDAAGYDLVCAFEVLEHLADDAAALAEWLPLVRPGGHLLLSVPADPRRFGPWDELVGHYRRYTAEQLRDRLVEAGATDVRLIHYGWPLGYLLDTVRNRLAGRRAGGAAGTAEERTESSGRVLQPRHVIQGGLVQVGVAPFAALQRLRPGTGPGLVAVATRPA